MTESPERWWFTLGQAHTHKVNGVTVDNNIIIEIYGSYDDARHMMWDFCGNQWCMQYQPETLNLDLFPRGVLTVNPPATSES